MQLIMRKLVAGLALLGMGISGSAFAAAADCGLWGGNLLQWPAVNPIWESRYATSWVYLRPTLPPRYATFRTTPPRPTEAARLPVRQEPTSSWLTA